MSFHECRKALLLFAKRVLNCSRVGINKNDFYLPWVGIARRRRKILGNSSPKSMQKHCFLKVFKYIFSKIFRLRRILKIDFTTFKKFPPLFQIVQKQGGNFLKVAKSQKFSPPAIFQNIDFWWFWAFSEVSKPQKFSPAAIPTPRMVFLLCCSV